MQLVNWILFYKNVFYGKTFQEIVANREPLRIFADDDDNVTAPEKWYEILRLDADVNEGMQR